MAGANGRILGPDGKPYQVDPEVSPFGGPRKLARYRPHFRYLAHSAVRTGRFTRNDVRVMLKDHAVTIGLATIYAPIHAAKWKIKCRNDEVAQFVDATFRRFWQRDLHIALDMIPWSAAAGEIWYHFDSSRGLWHYGGIDDVQLDDVEVLRRGRQLTGIRVSSTGVAGIMMDARMPIGESGIIRAPHVFWCAYRPRYGSLFGEYRLEPAFLPWMEKCGMHSGDNLRRLWFIGNAFQGGMLRYPAGGQIELPGGAIRDNQDYARELVEKFQTGAVMALPSNRDESGNYEWEFIPSQSNGDANHLLEYPDHLSEKIWEGMEVFPEVIRANDVGGGWSGRSVPLLVFLTSENQVVRMIGTSFDRCCVRHLVRENYGPDAAYEWEPESLIPEPPPTSVAPGGVPPPPGGVPPPAPDAGPAPAPSGGNPATIMGAPAMASQPMQLSAARVGVELPDDRVVAILESVSLSAATFDRAKHPRGQPKNAGQFARKAADTIKGAIRPGYTIPMDRPTEPAKPTTAAPAERPPDSSAITSVVETLKAAGHKASELEHAAKQYVADKCEQAVAKLPPNMQAAVRKSYFIGKIGLKGVFALYTVGQAAAERVARERGLTEEEARRLRGTLGRIDLGTFEVCKAGVLAGLHVAHLPAVATGLVPVASTGYLLYSTARDPLATLRAAWKATKDAGAAVGNAAQKAAKSIGLSSAPSAIDANANAVADALQAHGFDDRYLALLHAALDQVQHGRAAIALANELYTGATTMEEYP